MLRAGEDLAALAQQPHRAATADHTVRHPRDIDAREVAARDAIDFRTVENPNFGLLFDGVLAGHLRSPLGCVRVDQSGIA